MYSVSDNKKPDERTHCSNKILPFLYFRMHVHGSIWRTLLCNDWARNCTTTHANRVMAPKVLAVETNKADWGREKGKVIIRAEWEIVSLAKGKKRFQNIFPFCTGRKLTFWNLSIKTGSNPPQARKLSPGSLESSRIGPTWTNQATWVPQEYWLFSEDTMSFSRQTFFHFSLPLLHPGPVKPP